MNDTQPVWLLSPYHTGSHKAWAEGFAGHSHYAVELLTMAGRFWKWRMQGGAVELSRLARARLAVQPPQAIIATNNTQISMTAGFRF